MRRAPNEGRYAERILTAFDDRGEQERIVVWIERKEGGLWAVGRTVNPQQRSSPEPRPDDWIFEGYELGDALEAANGALESDVSVTRRGGDGTTAEPFTRDEVLRKLERWFFGHSPR